MHGEDFYCLDSVSGGELRRCCEGGCEGGGEFFFF